MGLPPRHMDIVRVVLDLWGGLSGSEQSGGLDSSDIITRLNAESEKVEADSRYWNFFVDTSGLLQSPQVLEDLDYLHSRGYCFCDPENRIHPTQRAVNVLSQYEGQKVR